MDFGARYWIRIPDSLSWITNSKPQDSEFHKFPGLPDMGHQRELNKRL